MSRLLISLICYGERDISHLQHRIKLFCFSNRFHTDRSLIVCPPILDHQGSPLVNQEGQALFGHGRESQPLVNPKDKFLTVGGKPIIGLDRAKPRTTTTTRPPTTTTPEPTTLPTTTEMSTEETITMPVFPTCPPGTFLIRDEEGFPMLDADGILDCYPEGKSD